MFSDPLVLTFVPLLVATIPLGLVAYILARQYRAHKERLWIHEETMTALKQGIAVDLPGKEKMTSTNPSAPAELFWMRSLAAFFGLLGIFVGSGIMVAFLISTNAEANEFWHMGLIPMFGGAGMLVFYLMLTYGFKGGRRPETGVGRNRLAEDDS